jgi:hypothetical protein
VALEKNKDDIWADRLINKVLHLIKKEFRRLDVIKRKKVIVLVISCVVTAFKNTLLQGRWKEK